MPRVDKSRSRLVAIVGLVGAITIVGLAIAAIDYFESFDSYAAGTDPVGWFDSKLDKDKEKDLFETRVDPLDPSNITFGFGEDEDDSDSDGSGSDDAGDDDSDSAKKRKPESGMSHYRAESFAWSEGFRFEGRMLQNDPEGLMGVTFLSSLPSPSYYLLAQDPTTFTVQLSTCVREDDDSDSGSSDSDSNQSDSDDSGSDDNDSDNDSDRTCDQGPLGGSVDSGISLEAGAWVRFSIQILPEPPGIRILAKLWPDGEGEPLGWSIDATDSAAGVPESGWIGVWAYEADPDQYWDDLRLTSDTVAPVITILESGAPLADGGLYNRTVVPILEVFDESPLTVTATLDGQSFLSGDPVASEGGHELVVTAVDVFGNSASQSRTFEIDLTPPVFVSILPPDDSVTAQTQVTLEGEVEGAAEVTVDGAPTSLTGNEFSSGPVILSEADNVFLLRATDLAGNATEQLHTLVLDTTPPVVSISQPPAGVTNDASVTVSGTAVDLHLEQVLVNGAAATVSGSSYSLDGVALAEGANSIVVKAVDLVGNSAQATRDVTLDTLAPEIAISGVTHGLRTNQTVVPVVMVTDATAATVEITLNGAAFASGTPVSAEGPYALAVGATDAAGNSASAAVSFEIDLTPPDFVFVFPADGTILGTTEVTLEGQVNGAVSVTVDGVAAALSGNDFSVGPFTLTGERTFELVATDDVGNSTTLQHLLFVDTDPPVIAILAPADGAVLGETTTDVSGTVFDPHLATVLVNGVSAMVSGEDFSFAGLGLTEGANVISVEAADTVGNSASAQVAVTVDTAPPVIEIRESGVALADGALFNRNVVPVLEITDATALDVQAFLNGQPFVSGSTVGADGLYNLSVTATDAAGNTASASVAFEIDTTPPVIGAIDPPDGTITAGAQVTLVGGVEGAAEVLVDGVSVPLAGNSFSAGPFPLAEGETSWQIVARDAAGNEASTNHRVIRDSTPPTLSIMAPEDAALLSSTAVDVSGEVQDATAVVVTVNGLGAGVTGASYLASQVPLVEGGNGITARAVDAAGNVTEVAIAVVLDTQPPVIAITQPAAGALFATSPIVVSGAVADPHLDRVLVNGSVADVASGAWSVSLPLAEGANSLTAVAIDRLGHSAEDSVTVVRDSTAPDVAIVAPTGGALFNETSADVEGTVSDEPGVTVTVNGVAAVVAGSGFTALDVPLVEGENRLVARATDPLGNQGAFTQIVFVDTVAPELESADPASGALAISTQAIFRLDFSETILTPAGSWRLETDAGAPLAATAELLGSQLVVRPDGPLPSGASLRLILTTSIADPAGNSLADPGPLVYRVADANAPDPPVVDPVPPFVCALAIDVSGQAEPLVGIEVRGGVATVQGLADASGAFSIRTELVADRINSLEVGAKDTAGNRSAAVRVEVVQDCTPPFVISVRRSGDAFTALFSEPIDPATAALPDALRLSASAGDLGGVTEVAASSFEATFTASQPVPDELVRFSVSTAIRDRAANPLAYPYAQNFGGATQESFVTGTVIDNATGRPLPGARVAVVATDGVALAEPLPEQVAGSDGRFSIPVPAGTHELAATRVGYAPVFRIVTTQSGRGTDLLDPRLTPTPAASAIGPSGGSFESPALPGAASTAKPVLSFPPGALSEESPVSITALDEQGLSALLPYGWSPRGGVWVDLGSAELLTPATLTLPVTAPNGANLAVVRLDLATLQWRVVRLLAVESGRVTTAIEDPGAYAVVEADTGAASPPASAVGSVLGSSPPPAGDEILGATIVFDPPVVLPAQSSRVTTVYDLLQEVPSGVPLTLVIHEQLVLLDGSTRLEPPYQADLVLYRAPDGSARSLWNLRPSRAARLVPLSLGHEDVALNRYAGETVRGNVLGPAGGTVTNDAGDRLDVPAGGLAEPTAVILKRSPEGALPLAAPAEGVVDGVVTVEPQGASWGVPATLSLAVDPAPLVGEYGLLLQVIEVAGASVFRAVAELEPIATGWTTSAIDPLDLAWPGVTGGGTFVFLRLTQDVAYLRGTVFDIDTTPLAGARLSAGSSWIQLANASGAFVLPALLGSPTAVAENLLTGNSGAAMATLAVLRERVDLDISLSIVAPSVVEVTPADGAVDIAVGVNPTVRFSEPIDPTSVAPGVELVQDGAALAVSFDVQGALVTIVPETSLVPGEDTEIRITSAVRDLQGFALSNPQTATFRTLRVLFSTEIDLSRVSLFEPDAAGNAAVVGEPGAVPFETLVFVENLTSFTATVAVEADQDGSFALEIEATVEDTLLLHVFIPGGNEIVLELTPFRTADGTGAWIGPRGGVFATDDDLVLFIEEGTFDETVRVSVEPEPSTAAGVAPPVDMFAVASFSLDLGGARAKKGMRISTPAAAGDPNALYLVAHPENSFWGRKWMLDDVARYADGRYTSELTPDELAEFRHRRGEPPLPEVPGTTSASGFASSPSSVSGPTSSPAARGLRSRDLTLARLRSSTLAGVDASSKAAASSGARFGSSRGSGGLGGPPTMEPPGPNNPDSDGDGMPDVWESQNGFDFNDPTDGGEDADEDLLLNVDEYRNGTDPHAKDTDGDGLEDGPEVNEHQTDPLRPDSDRDTLSDREEVEVHGTDPNLADTDGDTLSDGEEIARDTDPLDPSSPANVGPRYPADFPRWELDGMHSPFGKRSYQVWRPAVDLQFGSLALLENVAYFNAGLTMMISVDAAVARIMLPVTPTILIANRLTDPFGIEVRDLTTGFKLGEGEFEPAPNPGDVVTLPIDTRSADSTPPFPVGGSPIRFYPVPAIPSASGTPVAVAPNVIASFTRQPGSEVGTLTVTGAPAAAADSVQVRLLGLDSSGNVFSRSSEAGAFELTTTALLGERFLLALGARIATNQALVLDFSEALLDVDGAIAGIEVRSHGTDPTGGATRSVWEATIEPLGSTETVRIRPGSGWLAGETYSLRLAPELADRSENAWLKDLSIEFEIEESRALGSYPLSEARDVARLGSWLFVAGGFQGLAILDASDPGNLRNLIPGDYNFPSLGGDSVRGVAVDPHGRVLITSGGTRTAGRIRILDPLRLDEAKIAELGSTDEAVRLAARASVYSGQSLISNWSNGSFSQLPTGTPRKIAVLSNDIRDSWTLGQAPPSGVSLSPPPDNLPAGAEYEVTASGGGASGGNPEKTSGGEWITATGLPVTLVNHSTGSWHRVDADKMGNFEISLSVHEGDRLELIRNQNTIAYVAVSGAGIAAIDLTDFYNEIEANPTVSDVAGYYTGEGANISICPDTGTEPALVQTLNLGVLSDGTNPVPLAIPSLIFNRGLEMIQSFPETPGTMQHLAATCVDVEGSRAVVGLEVLEDFYFDLDGDGSFAESERRDYLVIGHARGAILIYDVDSRAFPVEVSRIRIDGSINHVAVDRKQRQLFAAGYSGGLYVIDLTSPASRIKIDRNSDGRDDRIVETIEIEGTTRSPIVVDSDRGLVYVGGAGTGLNAVGVNRPLLSAVARNATGLLAPIDGVAPLGVPDGPGRAASFFIKASLPSYTGDTIEVELESVGPGGLATHGAGDPDPDLGLPGVGFTADQALVLTRRSNVPTHPGYSEYLSEELVAIADLRALRGYTRSAIENDACIRCDHAALEIGAEAKQFLSGHAVQVRFPVATRTLLAGVYPASRLDASELLIPSVRWDLSPAVRQEPTRNPSYGSGDVAAGTLLASGEYSYSDTDLAVRGRGFDFAFTRTYRSQTVGAGPLGFGADHSYNQRLRELPNGDVEYYDGRARREVFRKIVSEGGAAENPDSPPKYTSPVGRFSELVRSASGYLLIDARRNVAQFDRSGRLTSLADATRESAEVGNRMTFHYDAASHLVRIEDTLKRSYFLEYDAQGRITRLTDFADRDVVYEYDAAGRLETVSSPELASGGPTGRRVKECVWETPPTGDLAEFLNSRDNARSRIDARGETWLQLVYADADGDGRADEVTGETWGEGALSILYDFDARTALVTDRRFNAWHYEHTETGQPKTLEDAESYVTRYEYNANGLVTQETLPLGRVTTTLYEDTTSARSPGNPTRITVAEDGRGPNGSQPALVTVIEYDPVTNQPTLIVDPRGAKTVITRDTRGLPTSVTRAQGSPEASTTKTEYNEYGQVTETANPNGHVTAFEYFDSGPSRGYLKRVIVDPSSAPRGPDDGPPLALTTSYVTDERGNVTEMTDPREVRHETDYNVVDWAIESRQAVSGATDGAGTAGPLGYTSRSFYDENGNVVRQEIPFGPSGAETTEVRMTYGLLDELLTTEREIESGGAFTSETRTYDANYNLLQVIHPEGNITRHEYDPRNLLHKTKRGFSSPDEVTDTYFYNADRERTTYTNGRSRSWTTDYDGYGRVMKTNDPVGNYSQTAYDDNGNAVRSQSFDSTDTLLAEGGAQFDLLNRKTVSTQMLFAAGDPATEGELRSMTTYDPASNVVASIDAEGRPTAYKFDAAERLVETTDPVGNKYVSTLDANGNAIRSESIEVVSDGSGVTSTVTVPYTASFDALNRRVSATDPLENTTRTVYDARSNVVRQTDPEGFFTTTSYDGLDRTIRTVRPEGISIDYQYDNNSRLRFYTDARSQTTEWTYDALDRKRTTTYPDQTSESYVYDAASNVETITDANGSVITQGFDPVNRLRTRTVAPGSGVEGIVNETYDYDGLYRVTEADSSGTSTTFTYDSLSRMTSEGTAMGGAASKTVSYAHDKGGTVTKIGYPSGHEVTQQPDPLDRPQLITAGMPTTASQAVAYGYRGPDLIQTKALGNGVSGEMSFDAAKRVTGTTYSRPAGGGGAGSPGTPAFSEQIAWSPRSLKVETTRADLGGRGLLLGYDGAGRVTAAAGTPTPVTPNNSTPSPDVTPEGGGFAFTYDAAENLLSRTRATDLGTAVVPLPLDGSQRNRPGQVGDVPLAYDPNGNLTQKGEKTFHYDYRNRIKRVTDSTGAEVASYTYDAFNRRVAKTVAGSGGPTTQETVWGGWQNLEEYASSGAGGAGSSQLSSRRTFGVGLDEIVRLETDVDGDGTLETESVPIYDSTGNLVLATGPDGRTLERYEYSPYGERTIYAGFAGPQVEQVRVVQSGGASEIWIELSKAALPVPLQEAVDAGTLTLSVDGTEQSVTVTQPVTTGRQARRRLVLSVGGIPDGATVAVTLPTAALVDSFGNVPPADFAHTFTWPTGGADTVVLDTAAPRVAVVSVVEGSLQIQLTEEANLASAATTITLDGAPTSWTLAEDRYTLTSTDAFAAGTHDLVILTTPLDLAGQGLSDSLTLTFDSSATPGACAPETVCTSNDQPFVYEGPEVDEVATSTIGNLYGFHGRPVDPETGLIYIRNRYYDPEMGRFVSVDPLGYVDGPSMYQYGLYSPFSESDPMGLESRSKYRATIERGTQAMREHAAFCRANPLELDCQGLIAGSLIRRFGDEAISDRAEVRPTLGPAGANPVLFVNGILNDIPRAETYAKETAIWLGRPVTPIWNPTRGGFEDILQTTLVNKLNLPDETTRLVVATIRDRLGQLGANETLTLVGHSQGAAISTSSLSHLTKAERSLIDFISIGGASCAFPKGLRSATAYINTRDIVPMGAGAGAPGCKGLAARGQSTTVLYSSFGVPFDFENTHGVDDYRRRSAATNATTPIGAEVYRGGNSLRWTIGSTMSRLTSPWFWYGLAGSQ